MTAGTNQYIFFKKPQYCRNASSIGYASPYVSIGDVIHFRTRTAAEGVYHYQHGKVLCGVRYDGCGKPYADYTPEEGGNDKRLLVLAADMSLRFGYERHVALGDVVEVIKPGAFARWFLFGQTPAPKLALAFVKYGAMCDSYIGRYLDSAEGKIDDEWHEIAMKRKEPVRRELIREGDGEYRASDALAAEGFWITVGSASVHIRKVDEGVSCSVYGLDREDADGSLAEAWATNAEICEGKE